MLATPDDLASYRQQPVNVGTAETVLRLADAWLMSAAQLTVWPSPTPDVLWAWEVELASLAYDNPRGYTSATSGGETLEWNYRQNRRAEILAEARRLFADEGSARGDFPPPAWWPEPTDRYAYAAGLFC